MAAFVGLLQLTKPNGFRNELTLFVGLSIVFSLPPEHFNDYFFVDILNGLNPLLPQLWDHYIFYGLFRFVEATLDGIGLALAPFSTWVFL